MKQPLTPKQLKTLKFLKQFSERKGYMPSLLEIGKRFKLTSKSSMWMRVYYLEQAGYIKKKRYHRRSIIII